MLRVSDTADDENRKTCWPIPVAGPMRQMTCCSSLRATRENRCKVSTTIFGINAGRESGASQHPRRRTISPFVTVPEWIENRIKDGTFESLRAAIQMDPANARLIAHFGVALANLPVTEKTDPDNARRARAEADYQTHRAVKLAPDNDEVKKLREEVDSD